MKTKTFKIIIFALLLIFYGTLLIQKVDLANGGDIARLIKDGELIVHGQFHVIYQNVYSYTDPTHQYINHNWLAAVIFYVLHQSIGWNGLIMFKCIVLLASFTIVFWTAAKKNNFWLVSLLSVPTIFILLQRTDLRPEIFSYLFMAMFLYVLSDIDRHPKRNTLFWLIPLQLLWVNVHLFFVIGIGLVAGVLLEKILLESQKSQLVIKKLVILLVSLIAVCFLNPSGSTGVLFPFQIFHEYGMGVSENQSIHDFLITTPLKDEIPIMFFRISVILLGCSFLVNFKRKALFHFVLGVATAIAGFFMIRLLAFFGLVFLLIASANLDGIFSLVVVRLRTYRRSLAVVFIAAISMLIGLAWSGNIPSVSIPAIGLADWSLEPITFIKEHGLKGPILNDYDIGSYLIYSLYPTEKVFVDNRPEAYSESFFKDTYLPLFSDETVWQKTLEIYQFNIMILHFYDTDVGIRVFENLRLNDPEWALVFVNPQVLIFLRNNQENRKVIDEFRITPDTIAQKVDHLIKSPNYEDQVTAADILNVAGRPDLGNKLFVSLVTKYPQKSKVWLALGEWEFNRQNRQNSLLAIMYLEKALATGQTISETYSFLGAAYMEIGEYEKAKAMLKKAILLDSGRQDAKELLQKITTQ